MKTPKITKLLPLALALMLTTTGAFAAGATTEGTKTNDNTLYQLNLDPFFDIDVTTPPTASPVSFTEHYTQAAIDNALIGTFRVVSNTNEKDIYLYALCKTTDGDKPAFYGSYTDIETQALNMVFTNEDDLPAGTSVTNLRAGGNESTTNNPNAIAFAVTLASTHDEGPTNAFLEQDYTQETGNVHYQVENSTTTITCTVNGSAVDNSFSTMDTDGKYKATLYLSDTPYSASL